MFKILIIFVISILLPSCATNTNNNKVPAEYIKHVEFYTPTSTDSTKSELFVIELDEPLKWINKVSPKYPPSFIRHNIPGSASIQFTIIEDGTTDNIDIVSASHEEFGMSAAVAVSQWRFSSPIKNGESTSIDVIQNFNFEYKNEKVWRKPYVPYPKHY